MSKLVLRNVSRTFGDFTAVENFNLELEEGELVRPAAGEALEHQLLHGRELGDRLVGPAGRTAPDPEQLRT